MGRCPRGSAPQYRSRSARQSASLCRGSSAPHKPNMCLRPLIQSNVPLSINLCVTKLPLVLLDLDPPWVEALLDLLLLGVSLPVLLLLDLPRCSVARGRLTLSFLFSNLSADRSLFRGVLQCQPPPSRLSPPLSVRQSQNTSRSSSAALSPSRSARQ